MTWRAGLIPKIASALVPGLVKPDGVSLAVALDGTLSVGSTTTVAALTDVSTTGGAALGDLNVLNRGGTDYKVTLSGLVSLFRRTPAGSRVITLAAGSTTATLTATDHDKTVVIAGSVAGTLAVDGTIADGFQCRVINHTGSALTYSGITGLNSTTALANATATTVTLSNATVEASAAAAGGGGGTPGGSSGQIQYNNAGAFGGLALSGLAITSGTLSITSVSAGAIAQSGATTGQLLAWSGTAWAPTTAYALPVASASVLGGVKQGSGVAIAGDGTISATGTSGVSTFNTRSGAVSLTLADVTGVTGTGSTARTNLSLATVASSGAYSDLSGAPTIPAAASTAPAVDGTAAAGSSAAYARADHVHPTDTSRLAAASNLSDLASAASARTNLGLGTFATAAIGTGLVNSSGTISVPATFSLAVSGVVGSLPGGAGAVVYRHTFVRPCGLAANLASPYAPQGQAATAPTATASFGISKRTAAGTTSSAGTISISPAGVVSSTLTATSFAAGDELVITAPSPADSTFADVALTFSGNWS